MVGTEGGIVVEALGGNAEHETGEVFVKKASVTERKPEPREWRGQTRIWIVEVGGAIYWTVATEADHAVELVIKADWSEGDLELEDPEAWPASFQEACGQLTNPEDCPEEHPVWLGDFLADQSARVLGCSEWP